MDKPSESPEEIAIKAKKRAKKREQNKLAEWKAKMARWKSNIKARKVGKARKDETGEDEPTNEDQDGEADTSRYSGSSQLVPVNLRPLDQRRFWTSTELEALDGRLLTLEAFYTAWAEQWVKESTGHLCNCDKGSQD